MLEHFSVSGAGSSFFIVPVDLFIGGGGGGGCNDCASQVVQSATTLVKLSNRMELLRVELDRD